MSERFKVCTLWSGVTSRSIVRSIHGAPSAGCRIGYPPQARYLLVSGPKVRIKILRTYPIGGQIRRDVQRISRKHQELAGGRSHITWATPIPAHPSQVSFVTKEEGRLKEDPP